MYIFVHILKEIITYLYSSLKISWFQKKKTSKSESGKRRYSHFKSAHFFRNFLHGKFCREYIFTVGDHIDTRLVPLEILFSGYWFDILYVTIPTNTQSTTSLTHFLLQTLVESKKDHVVVPTMGIVQHVGGSMVKEIGDHLLANSIIISIGFDHQFARWASIRLALDRPKIEGDHYCSS